MIVKLFIINAMTVANLGEYDSMNSCEAYRQAVQEKLPNSFITVCVPSDRDTQVNR